MNIRQSFKMAFKSIFSNKVRSFLTMLGIIIGVAAVVIMVSIVQGQNKEMKEYYESMGTNKISVYVYKFNGEDVTQDLYDYCLGLKNLVLGVTPSSSFGGPVKYMTKSTDQNQQYGMPPVYLGSDLYSMCNNYKLQEGRDLCWLDVKNYNQVVVIGAKLKEFLFDYKDPIGEKIQIGGQKFEVIGVYEAKGSEQNWFMDYMAVVPYSMSRILTKTSMMGEFTVKAKSAEATTEAITRLTGFLSGRISDKDGYFNVYTDNTWMQQNDEQNKMMSLVLGGIAGISLLVGGIGIMNIMLVTVRERTREIGIRKAIGGARKSILIQFLIEAGVICGTGGIFGIILGYLGTLVAGKLILNIVLLPSAPMTIGAFAFSVILGISFGMYPAVKASGLQPVVALRAE
ncbi:putative ABC transport system permease protein [Sporobacter termitidis DSM 10068]|uniref:Putative ABC transport system permease protein n=1 Tax=Sporobacter termitidis DSM 10068 TaxID=1123282 RepID=A0A1M5YWS0_9FIRM|nr:ABC transporter permease [Sporobacter termitidis]SHI16502.1 putative ABC transport system permease protein [Sporobacter termitidis DSM 10068]